jgi:potassium efflux system protein
LPRTLVGIFFLAALAACGALAQPATRPSPIAVAQIDKLQADLDALEKSLDRPNLGDASLQDLRSAVDPISLEARAAIEILVPKLAAIKARLDQLGPKPDEKGQDGDLPAETQAIVAERTDQQTAYTEIDDLLKRSRLIAVRADQAAAAITARRRAIFTGSLFERMSSIANPKLWSDVWRETPRHASAIASVFGEWFVGVNARLETWRLPLFWASLTLGLVAAVGTAWAAALVLRRVPADTEPSRFEKCLGAWFVALSIVIPTFAAIALTSLVFSAFGLTGGRLIPFWEAAARGAVEIAMIGGLTRGLLAPTRPNWRLLHRPDIEARRTFSLAMIVVSIVVATRLLESLNDIVGASLAYSVATRGVHAAIVAVVLGIGLWRLNGGATDETGLGPPVTGESDWLSLFRFAVWPVTLAIVVSILVGYITFASFLIDQLVWVGTILGVLFLAVVLLDESIAALVAPSSRAGNRLRRPLGLGQSSFVLLGAVISGIVRLALYALATILVVAPWGFKSADVTFDVAAAFFGFRLGDITISPASLVVATIIFGVVYGLARTALGWLDKSLLPHTRLDIGLRSSIKTSLGYVGFIVAAGLALGYLGVGVEKLALVAGALSVGIGFGLQSIVNNFVSGLILLWERAVRVGDWIVVGSDQGFVRRINVRSTEIETFDRSQVIIPNSSLVTGVVKNLVRNDRTGRITIPIIVAGSADPEAVREVLFAIAKAHELVLKFPAPQILFTSMSGSALTFELNAYVADVESALRVRSDLHFEIFKRFKDEGFFVSPGPDPTKVEIAGLGDLTALLGPKPDAITDFPEPTVPQKRSRAEALAGDSSASKA